MKFELPKIRCVRKRLANGEIRKHYYLGRGRGATKIEGTPGTPEFLVNVQTAQQAQTQRVEAGGRTLQWLIRHYLTNPGSPFNTKLRARTKDDYRGILTKVEARHGAIRLNWIDTRPTLRGEFKTWRGELAERSKRQADYAWSVLSAVFTHGVDYGFITRNPLARGGRLYDGTRIDRVWSEAQIQAFLKVARADYPELVMPMLIALWTGLHQTDVLTLPWTAYQDGFIRRRQRKGDSHGKAPKRLEIPCAAPLKAALDEAKKTAQSTLICVTSKTGRPWRLGKTGAANGFRASWIKCAKKAGVHKAVAFTDLRGTAVTRLWQTGVVEKRTIAIFTGHTEAEISEILRVHYLHREERAEGLAAIQATEALFASPTPTPESAEAQVIALKPGKRTRSGR